MTKEARLKHALRSAKRKIAELEKVLADAGYVALTLVVAEWEA